MRLLTLYREIVEFATIPRSDIALDDVPVTTLPVPREQSWAASGYEKIKTDFGLSVDIFGFTKPNYISCRLGKSQPVTVKFSDAVGEILVPNPTIPTSEILPQFRFYI